MEFALEKNATLYVEVPLIDSEKNSESYTCTDAT